MKLEPGEQVHILQPRVAEFPFPDDFPKPAVVTDVCNLKAERTLLVVLNQSHIVAIGVLAGQIKQAEGGRYRMGVRFGTIDPGFRVKDRQESIYRHIGGRTLEKIRAEREGAGVVMELSGGKLVLVNKNAVMVAE